MISLYYFIAYLVGSIPFSYLVPKLLHGIDIRKEGSGNAGVSNVLRTSGYKTGVLSLLGDFGKGVLVSYIGIKYFDTGTAAIFSALAILGHCYSPFLSFKGGKGIATTAGMLLVLSPQTLLLLICVQFGVLFSFGYMGLASICTALVMPIPVRYFSSSDEFFYVTLAISLFVIFKHQENIIRMIRGTEKRFKVKK